MNIRFYFKVVFKSLFLLLLLQFVFISLDSLEKNKLQYFVNVAKNISSKGILILTFTNIAHLSLAKHFICNLKDLNIEDSTLLIASDSITHKSLLNFETKIKTILLPSNTEKKDLSYGSKGFKDFIEYRTTIVLQLLSSNISVLLVDTDHYWNVSLLEWMKQQNGWDIIIENNSIHPKQNPCAGMIFLNSTSTTIQVWNKVFQQLKYFRQFEDSKKLTEQHFLSRILKKASRSKLNKSDDKKGFWEYADYLFPPPRNISWKYFPMDHVFSGKWYKDEVFRKNFNESMWSIHSNWIVGSSKKEEMMRKFNHFKYDKIKDKCK